MPFVCHSHTSLNINQPLSVVLKVTKTNVTVITKKTSDCIKDLSLFMIIVYTQFLAVVANIPQISHFLLYV